VKHIVIVSQVFYPNTQSTSQLLTDLALNFHSTGDQVTVICGFPGSSLAISNPAVYQGIKIYYCGFNVDLKKGLLQRLISYFSFLLHAGWQVVWLPSKDIILGVSNPPFLSIVLAIASYFSSSRYYFLVHDVYPEGLVAVGKLAATSPVTALWLGLNRWSYHRAAKLIALGRDMKHLLAKNYQLPTERIAYIPNWSVLPSPNWQSFQGNSLAIELGIQDKFVVQYSGNMGLWHDIDTFVRAAAVLQSNSRIQFLFIGNGIRKQQAQALAAQLRVNNIIWQDFLPKARLHDSLTCAHVALISLTSGLEGIAVPCKLYGILAAGRAILAQVSPTSEIATVVAEENCGFVVPPGNTSELVTRIEQLAQDSALVDTMGEKAFLAYQSKYTIQNIATQFQSLFAGSDLVGNIEENDEQAS
jgi:glycosyltransferase involved in cell wall biosynthesis